MKRKPASGVLVSVRRTSALHRLQEQLKRGSKPSKETKEQIPLTDKDKTRIEKEISILKSRG